MGTFKRGTLPVPMTHSRQPLPLSKRAAPRANRPGEWSAETIREFLANYIRWTAQRDKDQIFFKQYCFAHGIYPDDVQAWVARDAQYQVWYKRCMEAEQVHIAFMGARGHISPVSSIFYLKAQHMWKDTHTLEHTGAVLIQTDIRDLTK
jgi:hypothetical protein